MATFAVCSVRDVVASTFGRPFYAPNVGSAVRSVRREVNTPVEGNQLAQYPDDFELYELGTFDDQTCVFSMLPQPLLVSRCSALVDIPRAG